MREISLEELLEAGCHFGHQVTRSNPKARDYIYEARDNIHIIDLAKTKEGLENAMRFVKDLAARNGSLIVLGTKRQAQEVVEEEVKRGRTQISSKADNRIYNVTQRWVGGTMTNFSEVSKNLKKLKDLTEKLENEEEKAKYTKKEIGLLQKEKLKLESLYGGISDMRELPDAIFIIDSHLEKIAVDEARRMNVTTIAITDTNADPEVIDFPVPANDDATGSVKLIVKNIIDAWIEGRQQGIKQEEKKAKDEETRAKGAEKAAIKASEGKKEDVKVVKKINLVLSDVPVEEKVKKPAKEASTKKVSKTNKKEKK